CADTGRTRRPDHSGSGRGRRQLPAQQEDTVGSGHDARNRGRAVSEAIDRINMKIMTTASVVSQYARPSGLSPAEQATLDRVAPLAQGKPILDIGSAAGARWKRCAA